MHQARHQMLNAPIIHVFRVRALLATVTHWPPPPQLRLINAETRVLPLPIVITGLPDQIDLANPKCHNATSGDRAPRAITNFQNGSPDIFSA